MWRLRQLAGPSVLQYELAEGGETRIQTKFNREYLGRQGTQAWGEVQRDLKATKWKSVLLWFLYICCVGGVTGALVIVAMWSAMPYSDTACSPSGAFSQFTNSFGWFSANGFFQITLSFGSLEFSQAKAIDVVWDVVVGRGGQFIISVVSWNVFASYVTTSMATQPANFTAFWVVFLQKETSFFSLYHIMRNLKRNGIGSTISKIFIVGTVIFALAFATLASAMTGYTPANGSFVTTEGGSLKPFSEFSLLAYIIHDGKRIGLTNDYFVPFFPQRDDYESEPLISGFDDDFMYITACRYYRDDEYFYGDEQCGLQTNISRYVARYGFYGLNDTNSTFVNQSLESPALNISGFYFPAEENMLFGNSWTNPKTHEQPFQNKSNLVYMAKNDETIYNITYIKDFGRCQPISKDSTSDYRYQWGFSYMQLLIIIALVLVWLLGIGAMWIHASAQLPVYNELGEPIEVASGWKGIIQLAGAINSQLKSLDIDPDKLTNQELERKIRQLLKGGSVELEGSVSSTFGNQTTRWIKKEKWWIASFVVLACLEIPLVTSWSKTAGPVFMAGTFLAIFLALLVGSSLKSRLAILITFLVITVIVGLVVHSVTYGSYY